MVAYSPIHPSIHPTFHSLSFLLIHSLTYSLTYSPLHPQSLAGLFKHSLTNSLIHSFIIHSRTKLPITITDPPTVLLAHLHACHSLMHLFTNKYFMTNIHRTVSTHSLIYLLTCKHFMIHIEFSTKGTYHLSA